MLDRVSRGEPKRMAGERGALALAQVLAGWGSAGERASAVGAGA